MTPIRVVLGQVANRQLLDLMYSDTVDFSSIID